MSLIHLARQGFITKSALPNVTRQRGTTTGTANLMLYGAGKTHSIGTNTTFTDSSTNAFTVTRNGDTIQATNNPFTGSVYLDGNGDWLDVPSSANLAFGTGDYTVELWVFHTVSGANERYIHTTTNGFGLAKNTSNQVTLVQSGVAVRLTTTTALTINTWNHIAVVRSGTTATIYINGVSSASGTVADNYAQSAITIGKNFSLAQDYVSGYLTNIRMVKGSAVYTANFAVPTSPLTAITNTQLLLLTAQQAPFRDSSSNNFTVTANGNAAGNGVEPFPVNYAGSAYFDGTGDYLSVTNSAALQLTNSTAFTIECWVYPTNLTGSRAIIENYNPSSPFQGYALVYAVSSTNLDWWEGGASWVNTGITLTLNEWTHIAVTYEGSGTTRRFFKNGVLSGSAGTVPSGINYTAGACSIGAQEAGTAPWLGYISNVRIIKGTAQYTANFTPPSAPLTAVTNTSLLLLTNNVGPFVDTSANGFPVLRNGDAVQTGFSPFTGQPSAGSAYFDGTGDDVTVPTNAAFNFGTGDFTVECWVYQTANSGVRGVLGTHATYTGGGWGFYINNGVVNFQVFVNGTTNSDDASNSTAISLNTWTHIAAVRSSGNLKIYVNGVGGTAVTSTKNGDNTAAFYLGAYEALLTNYRFTGYISNLRVIKGTALYTSNFTPATAPLPAVVNTSLLLNTDNYTIANSTPTYLPVTVNGNTTVSTAQYPTGMNRSIYFDGNGDYLRISDNAAVELGANDFTIEMFVNFSSLPPSSLTYSYFISKWAAAQGSYSFLLSNVSNLYSLDFVYSTTGNNSFQLSVPWTPSVSTWYHIALVRNSTNLLFFVNGTQQSSTQTISATINNSNAAFVVGAYLEAVNFFHGYMSNLRLTVGSALYTANFTPPAAPLPLSVTVPAFVTNNIYGVYQLA